jgi:subtilase family serine protease
MIPESNENNNELCETLTLAIKSPDLTITQLTFEPTGSIHVGDTVQFRAEVANIGAGDYNGVFDIGFYVDDVYAGVTHVANGVPAGESIFSTFNWTASSCSDPVIIAKADFFDTVRESDKGNNEKTATLPASIPYADLAITDINWSPGEDIKDRDPVTFNVTVKNRGSGNVITDFSVYFDIDGYFTRTNVISGGLAAGESKTTSFTWKATPGDGHNATAKADPDNVVPESDKANNERVQLLPFNVSLVEIFEVLVEPAEITTGIGGQTSCKIKINNYGSASGNFGITVSGLDSDWYILSETSVYLSAGQEGVIDLDVSVPEACENSGTFPLQVTVTSQETGITKQGSANLIVEPTPVIHNLQPKDGASLGSDDVTFSWDTYINATTKIYLKSEGETDYTTYTGAEGQLHTAVISNLIRDKNYSYYAESTSTCGTNTSSVRTFYIGNGICFTKDVYDFTVERDYNQRVTIGVRNTDNEYHVLLVEVPTTYEDLVLGFVGEGSKDNIIPLNPGESQDITLAVHLQDAMNEEYEFMANLTSSKGDEILTDTARIKIHVHVPRIDYNIEEIGVDEITLMKTFRLTNRGDPITDLTISVADNLKENAYIEPVIEHYRLREGASVEFNLVPILSSPDFQPASPIPPVVGDIIVNAAGIEAKKQECFTVPEGKQPYKATVSSPGIINIGRVKTHHCNNKPNTKTPFDVHSGAKDKIKDDPLIIRFSSPGWEVKPHDLYISINGHEVGSLINTIPDGYYKFDVDPSFLIYPEGGVAKNYIELHSVHQNGGHYLVSSDVEVRLNLDNYETWVIASSQEEANQIAAENLPPGFYESPYSITIGEVEIAPEAGGSAVLSALSATSQVYLGKPTTIQTTAEPHLDVDAMFGNGDGTVHLAEVSGGVYSGRWTPRQPGDPSTGNCVITIRAKGSGVQGEKTQTVKILNPTKLILSITEPGDGEKIKQIEGWTEYYYGVQPVRATVTDDAGSEIKPSDVKILGRVVITKADKTTTAQQLSNWVSEGNGNFRCDWTPESPGDYEITVYAHDLTELKRKNAKASVTGTLEEAEIKLTNVKGPSGTIDPYWDYTNPPKKAFSSCIPTPYSANLLRCYCGGDFDVSFTLNKKAKVKYEIYSKGPDDWFSEWFWGDPEKTQELGTYEEGDHTFSIFDAVAYGDADHSYKIKIIAEAVEGEAKDSDDSVVFTIERKPYFKVDKKAKYVGIEGPSFLSIGYFVLKPLIGLFNPSASAAIVYHIADLGVSSQPAADYEKIVLVEEWWIEEYNWDNKRNWYVLHHDPNAEAPRPVPPEGDIIPRGGALYVESRTYYKEKKTTYFEIAPSNCPTTWYTYEGAKFVMEGGAWKLAQAGKKFSHRTRILVTAVSGLITIADKIESTKEVTELVPTDTEIIIYMPACGRHMGFKSKCIKCIETRGLESYEAKYGPRPKPAMNFNSIMNPTQKSHTIHDVLVDDSVSEATFYITWNSAVENKTKRLTIENPQGAVIDSVTAPTNPDMEYLTYIMSNSDAGYQGITELYRVMNPAPGTWKMNVSSLGTGTLEYYMGVFADSEIALSFDTDKMVYAPNESMTLEARLLYEDDSITDATVTTEIRRPDGIKETITLFDDGNHDDYQESDGIYANVYANLSIAGEYWLNINASGSTEKGEFRRATSVKKIVQDSPIVFIDNPHDNETIDGVVNIGVSAVDNSGIIANYEILIDSVKVSNSNSYSWNTFSADGTHTIEGKATDDDENTGTAQITVTVSNIPDPSDTVAPSAPTGVAISVVETGNALNVTCTPNTEPDLAGYNVYRAYVSGGPYSKLNLDPIEDTAYIDDGVYNSGLNGKRMYHYVITAVDENHLESNFSGEVSGKPLASWVEPFDSDVYINTSLSHNIAVADGKLTLSEGITSCYAVSEAIKPESLISWKNIYWLESTGDQIITLKISQEGIAWQMVSNGDDISGLDPAQPLFYNCTMVSDGVNESALYELLLTFTMDQEPIGFTSVIGDKGTDEDSNGLYDYLTISVGVDIESPGHYYVVGDLKDKDGSPLFLGHQSLYYLTEGNQTINLTFEGETIYQHCVNGTYTLVNLELQDVEFRQIDLLSEAYETQSYNYTEFEEPPARFDDTYSDQGTDTDGDGLYNTLTVNTGINVTTSGNYMVIGTLEDNAGYEIVKASNSSQLEGGSHTIPLEFSGTSIRKHGVDGPYYLRNLTIFYQNETSIQVGYRSEAYTTNAYNYMNFQKPPVAFTDSFSDRGTDTNGDGKYDYLTIDIEVDVENEGQYNISGMLEDVNGSEIIIATSTVNIADKQTVQLNFDGLLICGHMMNGPYKIKDLLIYNVEDRSLFDFLSDAYTTSAYNFADFQTSPLDLTLLPIDITFSNDVPVVGEQITINATIRNDGTVDANGVVVQFWDGNPEAGGTQIEADQTIASIAHTETAQVTWTAIPGTHDIFVRVDPYNTIQEANENNNQAHKPITIEPTYNQLPIASFTYSPLNPAANETITFNATNSNSYDPAGFIVNYEWVFGDDIAATGEIVEHSYSNPGDYTVILRVTDNASLSNTNTLILTVTLVETAVCGDVTGDINVTMADARRIVMWLSYPEAYPIHNLWAADVTGDGTVTMADARRIVMWLSYPYQYPLTCSPP